MMNAVTEELFEEAQLALSSGEEVTLYIGGTKFVPETLEAIPASDGLGYLMERGGEGMLFPIAAITGLIKA